jgi:hypothetical protein
MTPPSVAQLRDGGVPEVAVPLLASFGAATRAGYLARVTSVVPDLTGRTARAFTGVVRSRVARRGLVGPSERERTALFSPDLRLDAGAARRRRHRRPVRHWYGVSSRPRTRRNRPAASAVASPC